MSTGSLRGLWGAVDFSPANNGSWIRDHHLASDPARAFVSVSGVCALRSAGVSVSLSDDRQTGSPSHPYLAIVANVTLHNRRDLLRALGSSQLTGPDDAELVLAAYVKWGTACANHLLGEFAFAIWDERDRRLFCCRDHIGFRAFLYWRNESRFIFGGDSESILECEGVPRKLNRRKFADLAVASAQHSHPEETFHAGILSLPPGTWMTVERDRTLQQKYWKLEAGGGPVPPQRPAEALEALREVLFEAVDCRLDSDYPVAALLSGGLDSSSIVSIAARCLEKRNRQLTAISAVLPEESRAQFKDESDYIDEFRSWPNVRIRYVTARGRGPFDCLDDLSRFAVFPLRTSRFYLTEECEKAALANGSRSLLWGVGGELGPTSWHQRYFLELGIGLRWATLARELSKSRVTFRNVSPIRVLAGQFVNALFPNRRAAHLVLVAPGVGREYKVARPWISRSFNQRRYQAASIRHWLSKHSLDRGRTINLISPVTPLYDKRVLEFCLALPASMGVRDGYRRYLIRGALDGILPRRIQWRTEKLPYSPDYFARYNAQLGMARKFVAAIGPNDPVRSVIDVEQLEKLLHPVDAAVGSAGARDVIPVTMYMINFLRQFSDFRP
jgi:asparagine synthase (glutamine-hydrolysing)